MSQYHDKDYDGLMAIKTVCSWISELKKLCRVEETLSSLGRLLEPSQGCATIPIAVKSHIFWDRLFLWLKS